MTGYRPGALDAFGLAPEALAQRHPGLVIVTLSAWGSHGPWAGRRGFDSLVQAACGIAADEGGPDRPGALPCQLLDHATGYLGAAAAMLGLRRQRAVGGTPHTRLALVATAGWLQGLPAHRGARSRRRDRRGPLPRRRARTGRRAHAGPPARNGGRGAADLAGPRAVLRHRCGRLVDLMTEMTDLSSPLWQVFSILAVSASLAMMVRWWYLNRRK